DPACGQGRRGPGRVVRAGARLGRTGAKVAGIRGGLRPALAAADAPAAGTDAARSRPASLRGPAWSAGAPRGAGPGSARGGAARARALARAAPPARLASLKPLARDSRAAPHCRAVPELPEVEIASRQLRAWAKGRRVVAARAERSRVIRGQSPQRFAQLAGHRLQDVERSGKWMLLRFDGDEGLVSHLGMTGKWIRRERGAPSPSHVRASLELEDGHVLDYRDPRLFGRLIRG